VLAVESPAHHDPEPAAQDADRDHPRAGQDPDPVSRGDVEVEDPERRQAVADQFTDARLRVAGAVPHDGLDGDALHGSTSTLARIRIGHRARTVRSDTSVTKAPVSPDWSDSLISARVARLMRSALSYAIKSVPYV
jgi:hypothetical protein